MNSLKRAIRLIREERYSQLIKESSNKLRHQALYPLNRWRMRRLVSSSDTNLKKIGTSIQKSKREPSTERERTILGMIEERHFELENDSTEIEIVDYGAGDPDTQGQDGSKTKSLRISEAPKCSIKEGSLLFHLVRNFTPSKCLELGTSVGMSAAYQGSAASLNGNGEVVTLEGSETIAGIAVDTFNKLNLENIEIVIGPFQKTLSTALTEHQKFDFVIIDGHHEKEATKKYWDQISTNLEENAIVVFDDIHWSQGMEQAWNSIRSDELFEPIVDIWGYGIGVKTSGSTNESVTRIY